MSDNKVKKAVIPAAGLGTRFLPATKTVPKELLPIVDKPSLLYIVEEAVNAGIEDIVLVAGRNKTAIEDFFDTSYELEDQLIKAGKEDLLARVTRLKDLANIISIRQKRALGLGHAVLSSEPVVGKEPFAVLLGDEVMITGEAPSVTTQLANVFNDQGTSTVAVMPVAESEVSKYGIVDAEPLSNGKTGVYRVQDVVEKPSPGQAPSRLALPGRYIFSSKIYDFLKETKPGKNGEIQLTDPMTDLARSEGLLASEFEARRFDAGDKLGYLQANIELGLEHPELGAQLRVYLKDLGQRL